MVTTAEKGILEYKKAIFLKEVGKAAGALGVNIPKVKFWGKYDYHFDKGERAHIHIKENLICIAEPELNNMSKEEIIDTATHEISHLRYLDHGPEFRETQKDLEIVSWEPPSGTTGAFPRGYVPSKEEKIKNIRPIKYKCNFCEKRIKTKRCKYCGGYFCEEHIQPKEPFIGHPINKIDNKDNKNTHICSFAYSKYLKEQERKKREEENKKCDEALDSLSGKSKFRIYKIDMKKENKEYEKEDSDDDYNYGYGLRDYKEDKSVNRKQKEKKTIDESENYEDETEESKEKEDKEFIYALKVFGIILGLIALSFLVKWIFF
jgi:hypothetical protein